MSPTNPQPTNQSTNNPQEGKTMEAKKQFNLVDKHGILATGDFEQVGRAWMKLGGPESEYRMVPVDEDEPKPEPEPEPEYPANWRTVNVGPTDDDPTKPSQVTSRGSFVCDNSLTLEEDTDDDPTEEVQTSDPVTVTPSVTVGQRNPVTVDRSPVIVDTRTRAEQTADAEADTAQWEKMGLTGPRLWQVAGTQMGAGAVAKWNRERRDLANLPRLTDAAAEIRSKVKAERREDLTVDEPHKLRLENDGGVLVLHHPDWQTRDAMRLEPVGMRAFLSNYGRSTAKGTSPILPPMSFLQSCTPDEVVKLWNSRAPRIMAGPSRILRTRIAPDGYYRSVFAVVSEQYAAVDIDQTVQMLADTIGPDATAELAYNATDTVLHYEVASMRDQPPTVGEFWKVGFKGSTGDAANKPSRGGGFAVRVECMNGILMSADIDPFNQRHRGSRQEVADKIREAIRESWENLQPVWAGFSNRWEVMADTAAVDVFGGVDVADAIAAMVAKTTEGKALVKASEVERDALVQMLLHTHSAEPGETVADVVNAVTRLHESKLPVARVAAVEAVAGRMVEAWSGGIA
tara:strand:+ start:3917 stop:5632 length:1716 start_codon:yes stop_codon:yes gene_type:complete